MPMVRIEWMAGRTAQQKREMAARVTDALTEIAGVRPADVWIVFEDVAPGDWAAGGRLVADG